MPLTLKMVASEVMMCGLKKVPVVGTAFEVVDALRTSHAHTVIGDRLADIEDQLSRWEKRQRTLVAEEIQTILGNLARPGMDGASLTEEIRNLRQIQEQGWNPSLFEGLMLNSSHMAELKRNPHHYGRILDDRDPVDPAQGIHILLDADKTRVLELTPFAFSQLLANQASGVPDARMQLGDGIWAFPEAKVTTSPEPKAKTPPPAQGKTVIVPPRPTITPADQFTNSLGMTMIRIEPGEFLISSTKSQIDLLWKQFPNVKREWLDREQPQHPVKITRPFYLAAHQVTVRQFRRFVEGSGYITEAESTGTGAYGLIGTEWKRDSKLNWRNPGFKQDEDHPVVCVSHKDAVAFLNWLNDQEKQPKRSYRLPTEAQWEYAGRAGTAGLYGESDDPESLVRSAKIANASPKKILPNASRMRGDDGFAYTSPVGSFEPNAWQLYDMIGNVWEWCDDWFDAKFYHKSPTENPCNSADSSNRVVRGGSWRNAAGYCRAAYRSRDTPTHMSGTLGLRLARVPSGQ